MTEDDESSGTSAHGVALAVGELTDGRLAVHPVSSLDASGVGALLRAAAEADSPVVLIANVQTGAFWARIRAPPSWPRTSSAVISARARHRTGRSGTSSASWARARVGPARS